MFKLEETKVVKRKYLVEFDGGTIEVGNEDSNDEQYWVEVNVALGNSSKKNTVQFFKNLADVSTKIVSKLEGVK